MSVTRSRLVAGVYKYAGVEDKPLPDGCPQDTVYEILVDIEDEMLRDLDLSTQNRRVSTVEVSLSESTFTISPADYGSAAYVTLQTDPTSDLWYPVDIINAAGLAQATLDGRLAVAFKNGTEGEVSWTPDSAHTLKIRYDRTRDDDPRLADSTELGTLYDSHLKIQVAAQVRELCGLPVGDVLAARLARSERQWRRNVTMSRQQGQALKSPVFTPPRYRRRAYPYLDRTRFFVP